ncbi:MAG: hypothetical protein ACK5ZH_02640 [Alphaproteobacteria bacterium]|jgi:hypothetical protein
MVDIYQPEPFEQRKSQNLSFWDYAKQSLFWGALPILSGLATFTVGRLGKNKIYLLDGSPTIIYSAYEKLFLKTAKHTTGMKIEIEEVQRLHPFNLIFSSETRLARTKDTWNFLKGFEIGTIPFIYHLWRNKEQERLDIVPVAERLKHLQPVKPSDEELRTENESLRLELAATAPQARISAKEMQHDGKMKSLPERAK